MRNIDLAIVGDAALGRALATRAEAAGLRVRVTSSHEADVEGAALVVLALPPDALARVTAAVAPQLSPAQLVLVLADAPRSGGHLRVLDVLALASATDHEAALTPEPTDLDPALADARRAIDAVDRELVALLARRAALVSEAMRVKASRGIARVDPDREARMLATRRASAREHGLDPIAVDDVFRAVLRLSRRLG